MGGASDLGGGQREGLHIWMCTGGGASDLGKTDVVRDMGGASDLGRGQREGLQSWMCTGGRASDLGEDRRGASDMGGGQRVELHIWGRLGRSFTFGGGASNLG